MARQKDRRKGSLLALSRCVKRSATACAPGTLQTLHTGAEGRIQSPGPINTVYTEAHQPDGACVIYVVCVICHPGNTYTQVRRLCHLCGMSDLSSWQCIHTGAAPVSYMWYE